MDEALRRLEREALAQDTASAWTGLAEGLARAGRPDAASDAATRALALDPASPARALVRPGSPTQRLPGLESGVTSVAWRGLRGGLRARTVEVGPGSSHAPDAPLDLGQGRVAVQAASGPEIAVVDLVEGRVLWRDRLVGVAAAEAGLVALGGTEGNVELVTHDPLTGAVRGRARIATYYPEVALLAPSALVLGRTLAWVREPTRRLELHDLVEHRAVASAELPKARGRLPDLVRAGPCVVAMGTTKVLCIDTRGEVAWRTVRPARRESCLGVVDDRLLLIGFLGASLLDGAKGTRGSMPRGWLDGAVVSAMRITADALVILDERGERVVGVDRRTFEPRWEQPAPGLTADRVLTTADAVLLLDHGEVRSLDAATGEPLAETELAAETRRIGSTDGAPTLAAGRLLLWSNGGPGRAATLTIVEESSPA